MKGVAANESRHRQEEARGMKGLRVTGGKKRYCYCTDKYASAFIIQNHLFLLGTSVRSK